LKQSYRFGVPSIHHGLGLGNGFLASIGMELGRC
jgi:hypothetical protein